MIPYKDDNPARTIPFITISIISLNILVYIMQLMSSSSNRDIIYSYGAIPNSIMTFVSNQPIHPLLTIITSMFMHAGLFHIGGNMLYLWIFGNNVEDRLGHSRFALYYLFCGTVAVFAHAFTDPHSMIPMVGASGAVSGVLGAYILLYPMARIHTLVFLGFFITVLQVPALIVIGLWAIIQIVNGLLAQGALNHGGVAWFAHMGGFVAGLLTIKLWLKRRIKR